MKTKSNNYETISVTLSVTGQLWCGQMGECTYPLDRGEIPKNLGEVKAKAGDFESIETAKILRRFCHVRETTETLI